MEVKGGYQTVGVLLLTIILLFINSTSADERLELEASCEDRRASTNRYPAGLCEGREIFVCFGCGENSREGDGYVVCGQHCSFNSPQQTTTQRIIVRNPAPTTRPTPAPTQRTTGPWSSWGQWTACDECSGSVSTRFRVCRYGQCRGSPSESKTCPCNEDPQIEGRWSAWTNRAECSSRCSGYIDRYRVCEEGQCEGASSERVRCYDRNSDCTPVQGEWGQWGTWGSCQGGQRQITRRCDSPLPDNGGSCTGSHVSTQRC